MTGISIQAQVLHATRIINGVELLTIPILKKFLSFKCFLIKPKMEYFVRFKLASFMLNNL